MSFNKSQLTLRLSEHTQAQPFAKRRTQIMAPDARISGQILGGQDCLGRLCSQADDQSFGHAPQPPARDDPVNLRLRPAPAVR